MNPSLLSLALSFPALAASVHAQWNPAVGQWGKSAATDLRVMTYNVLDAICSSNTKNSTSNNWTALARLIAAMQPDILLLQECGDNSGNGTGSGVDSVSQLTTAIGMFLHGGNDTFHAGNPVITAYVQAYAPAYDLPYVFVSASNDGYNRNVILSRFPFRDLNGDTQATLSDIPNVTADLYAPGGNGGIRGFMFAEIDLPDALYAGDLVVGNAHLKAGGGTSNHNVRVTAARNVAYFLDYFYNGANGTVPDPRGKIADSPPATSVLDANTSILVGGDWNEDEWGNGTTVGPADWLARAATFDSASGTDGTDRNRTDMTYDHAPEWFSGSLNTYQNSSYKDDYLCWQDSMVAVRRAFQFDTAHTPVAARPPQLGNFANATAVASDHRPVIADCILPAPLACNSAGVDLGFAKLGGNDKFPRLAACGTLSSGHSATLTLSDCPPFATVFALVGTAATMWNTFGATVIPVPLAVLSPFSCDGAGTVSLPLAGGGGPFSIYVQWGILDPGATEGLGVSNALRLDILR
ncbi:MAG: endonuclease/exonuclease/phosphatase family protein [Planctomycetota bacterium]